MKKFYRRVVFLALSLIGLVFVPAAAQVSVSLPEAEARVGDAVALEIAVGDLTGMGVLAYEFAFEYDPAILEVTEVDIDGTLSEGRQIISNLNEIGVIKVAAAGAEAISGSGTLLIVKGNVIAEDLTSLTFTKFFFNEGEPVAATADGTLMVTAASGVANENEADLPRTFSLRGNYPNPFNPATTIRFDLPETSEVRVRVFDLLGHEVLSVGPRTVAAGSNRTIRIEASNLASGLYLYQVITSAAGSSLSATGLMTFMK